MKKYRVVIAQTEGKYNTPWSLEVVAEFDTYAEADEFWCKKNGKILSADFESYQTLDIIEVEV